MVLNTDTFMYWNGYCVMFLFVAYARIFFDVIWGTEWNSNQWILFGCSIITLLFNLIKRNVCNFSQQLKNYLCRYRSNWFDRKIVITGCHISYSLLIHYYIQFLSNICYSNKTWGYIYCVNASQQGLKGYVDLISLMVHFIACSHFIAYIILSSTYLRSKRWLK